MTRLDNEIEYFNANLADWLSHYKGQFALIKDSTLVGTFTTPEEAYVEGIKLFGNVPFLVHQVKEEETVDQIPTFLHGLIRAGL